MSNILNILQWKWVANTLNPYYEGNSPSNMISDDRFMFHTLNNWDFGVDSTGNLMDWENSQAIIKKAKSLGKVIYFLFVYILKVIKMLTSKSSSRLLWCLQKKHL